MQPLVSIVIPTYNRAKLIVETLDSILEQTYKNWECIVVDDGSTDDTEELLKEYTNKDNRFKYIKRPTYKPKGANACRNYGFEVSKGEYINWFDSDDIMHPDKISFQVNAINGTKYNYTICQTLIFDNNIENIIGLRSQKLHSVSPFDDYVKKNIVWLTQAPLWKKQFLKKFDYLFDEELQAAQEWEFYSRILNKEPNYHFSEKPLVFLRKHENNISRNSEEEKRLWNYFLSRYKIYYNKRISLNNITEAYLRNEMINFYRRSMESGYSKIAWKQFNLFILKEKKIKTSVKLLSGMLFLTYSVFKRGYWVSKKLQSIQLNDNL